ncbi:hypothetical protein Tco_0040641 [Tanacetum coccineum]
MRLHSSTWATKWFKRLVAYAKCNRDSYESELVIQGMHMTRCWDTNQAARKHPEPSWLNAILDDEVSCDGECCSKKKTWSIA